MSKENLKKELLQLIDKIDDEETLSMVKGDIVAYQKSAEEIDDLSDLTPEERAELEELANEDPDKDSISYDEFKIHMKQWLSKL